MKNIKNLNPCNSQDLNELEKRLNKMNILKNKIDLYKQQFDEIVEKTDIISYNLQEIKNENEINRIAILIKDFKNLSSKSGNY